MALHCRVRMRPFLRLCGDERTRSWQGRTGEVDPLPTVEAAPLNERI